MKRAAISKLPSSKARKLRESEKNYHEIMERIKPFIRKSKIRRYATAGEWKLSSHDMDKD